MKFETERLIVTEFDLSMAEDVHQNSLDEDTRRFLPDEVFETVEEAKETIEFLMSVYASKEGPLVYPVLLKDQTNIGYVQLVPLKSEYEVGYHIAKSHTCKGYATEALREFLSFISTIKELDQVWGITVIENSASIRVLEKSGFRKVFEGIGHYQGQDRMIVKYVYSFS